MSVFGYIVLYLIISLIETIVCLYIVFAVEDKLTIGDLFRCIIYGALIVMLPAILLHCFYNEIKDKVIFKHIK